MNLYFFSFTATSKNGSTVIGDGYFRMLCGSKSELERIREQLTAELEKTRREKFDPATITFFHEVLE